jgi:glycosyltransferase involved in cell wall biosynthesis
MSIVWHLLTGEYPGNPSSPCGGVGDYTAALAAALAAAGDAVHVWTPARSPQMRRGVNVHVLPDAFGKGSRGALDRAIREIPGVVLLQYVPNALGARGANLPFCLWLSRLARGGRDVRVMFHEPYFYLSWSRPWTPGNALALVQRIMARILVRGARRVYQSTDTWRRYLPGAARLRSLETLAIPSTVPLDAPPADRDAFRRQAGATGETPLAGHFGTYGAHVARELRAILPALAARRPDVRIALVGDGGPAFLAELARTHPAVARCAYASGRLDPARVAAALRACDVLLQPYPDGITTRRTSAMAGIANGVPTVTTAGALTEPVWADTGAVAFVPAGDADAFVEKVDTLLRDTAAREALGRRAASAYAAHFSMDRTVAMLRSAAAA